MTSPEISFTPEDLSSPENFGSKLLREANSISQAKFKKSIQQVIEETPKSRLASPTNSRARQTQKRQILREIKEVIQSDMNENADKLVLQNRLSWNRSEKVRKSQGLATKTRKRKGRRTGENREEQSAKKRRHGCTSSSLNIDKEQLMSEACTWQPDENINWSELGCRYGLHTANRGQIIKEYLAEQGILIRQRERERERERERAQHEGQLQTSDI